jgi:hypothetical protein
MGDERYERTSLLVQRVAIHAALTEMAVRGLSYVPTEEDKRLAVAAMVELDKRVGDRGDVR